MPSRKVTPTAARILRRVRAAGMKRNPYRARLFPLWAEEVLALLGLLLILGTLGFWAIYAYALEMGAGP